MSNRYITAAMEMKVGSATKKLILIKLADNANDDGICWPSYATIARHCEVDKRTVIRHIKDLQEMGVLSKQHRMTSKGNSSNYFQMHIPSQAISGGDKKSLGGGTRSLGGWQSVTRGVAHDHPEPSIEPSIESKNTKKPGKTDFSPVIQKWNEVATNLGLQTILGITDKRKREIKNAYTNYKKACKDFGKEPKDMVGFLLAIIECANLTHTEFHLGGADRDKWRMNFDYLMQKKVIYKVTETGSIA